MSVKVKKEIDKNLKLYLNELYSGTHGQIRCLIISVTHYFLLKAQGENKLSDVVLSIIISEISGIIRLVKSAQEEGIELTFLDYNTNKFEYYLDKNKSNYKNVEMLLLEEISAQSIFLAQCEKVVGYSANKKIRIVIEGLLEQTRKVKDIFLGE